MNWILLNSNGQKKFYCTEAVYLKWIKEVGDDKKWKKLLAYIGVILMNGHASKNIFEKFKGYSFLYEFKPQPWRFLGGYLDDQQTVFLIIDFERKKSDKLRKSFLTKCDDLLADLRREYNGKK